mgnify:CR=1 FL=1
MKAYLDNASTSIIRKEVYDVMKPFFETEFGNPSSLHNEGIKNRKFINSSRKKIASLLGCNHKELFFTSCGTESINWAIQGIALKNRVKSKIITTRIEHHATLETVLFLESRGYVVEYVNTDLNGFVDLNHLEELIDETTLLVSIILANNEIGTIQNSKLISQICNRNSVYLHFDAVQAVCHMNLDFHDINADLISISGHKFNAPKGIGILYIKEGTEIGSLLHGGQQENDRRAGTENIAYIAAITKALELGISEYSIYQEKLNSYSNYIINELKDNNIDFIINGPEIGISRLPGNLNLSFKDLDGDTLTFYLNKKDIYVSTGSACDSTSIEPSHVVSAIGVPSDYINATIRISIGYQNTFEEIQYAVKTLIEIIKDNLKGE